MAYEQKPIVFFDLETTGVSITKDRIVQIGAIKVFPNGLQEEKNVVVNPTIPIPKGASAVHGITDDEVKDKPKFKPRNANGLRCQPAWFRRRRVLSV